MNQTRPSVILMGGGIDSAALIAYEVDRLARKHGPAAARELIVPLWIDYGQAAAMQELWAVERCAESTLGSSRPVLSLHVPSLGPAVWPHHPMLGRDDNAGRRRLGEAASGWHIIEGRNTVLAAIALARCAHIAGCLLIGLTGRTRACEARRAPSDVGIDYAASLNDVAWFGMARGIPVRAPLLRHRRATVVRLGARLGANFAQSWSCYLNGTQHCGRCPACLFRQESFAEAKIPDPTIYEAQEVGDDA